MKFIEIIEKLKEKQGLKSNKDAQRFLGFSSETGFYYMLNGKGGLKDEVIAKLIEGTGLPAPLITGAWEAEHSKSEIVRKSWENWLKAVAVMAILGAVVPYAATLEKDGIAQCLLCKIDCRTMHNSWLDQAYKVRSQEDEEAKQEQPTGRRRKLALSGVLLGSPPPCGDVFLQAGELDAFRITLTGVQSGRTLTDAIFSSANTTSCRMPMMHQGHFESSKTLNDLFKTVLNTFLPGLKSFQVFEDQVFNIGSYARLLKKSLQGYFGGTCLWCSRTEWRSDSISRRISSRSRSIRSICWRNHSGISV